MDRTALLHLVRYGMVSVGIYAYLVAAMAVAVDLLGLPKVPSYVAIQLSAHVIDHHLNLALLFRGRSTWGKALRYAAHVAFFLGLGTLVFRGLLALGCHHLAATLVTAALLMPLRYLSYRWVVYR